MHTLFFLLLILFCSLCSAQHVGGPLTFSRASAATYVNADGIVVTAASGVPRFDHDPVTKAPLGLLLEQARTNANTYGGATPTSNGNGWTYRSPASYAEIIPSGGPDTASFLRLGTASLWKQGSTGGNTTHTFSAYLRKSPGTPSATVKMMIKDFSTDTIRGEQTFSLTDQWARYSVTGATAGAIAGWRIEFVVAAGTEGSVDLALVQIEAGSYATSYIPTTTSTVTRAADVLNVTGSAFSDFYNPSEGTVLVEFDTSAVSSASLHLWKLNQNDQNFIAGIGHSSLHLRIAKDNVHTSASDGVTQSVPGSNRMAFSWTATGMQAARHGVVGTLVSLPDGLPAPHVLTFGTWYTGYPLHMNGHIKRFTYWPYAVPAAQLAHLSAP